MWACTRGHVMSTIGSASAAGPARVLSRLYSWRATASSTVLSLRDVPRGKPCQECIHLCTYLQTAGHWHCERRCKLCCAASASSRMLSHYGHAVRAVRVVWAQGCQERWASVRQHLQDRLCSLTLKWSFKGA